MNLKNFIQCLRSNEFLDYFIVYMLPSSTPLYIIIREGFGYGMLFSYIVANLIGVLFCYYLYKVGIMEKINEAVLKFRGIHRLYP